MYSEVLGVKANFTMPSTIWEELTAKPDPSFSLGTSWQKGFCKAPVGGTHEVERNSANPFEPDGVAKGGASGHA